MAAVLVLVIVIRVKAKRNSSERKSRPASIRYDRIRHDSSYRKGLGNNSNTRKGLGMIVATEKD